MTRQLLNGLDRRSSHRQVRTERVPEDVNALMLQLVAALVPGIRVKGFGAALLGSLLLTLLNVAVAALMVTVPLILQARRLIAETAE